MTKSGHKVKVLDSSLQPEERDKIMEEFRGARIKVDISGFFKKKINKQ